MQAPVRPPAPPSGANGSLNVGEIVRRVFRAYVDLAPILFPAAAAVFVVEAALAAVVLSVAPGALIVVVVLDLAASSIFTGLITEFVPEGRSGRREARARELLRAVRPVLGELLQVSVASAAAEALGLLLIVPGLLLLTWWAVAAPIVVVERPGSLGALARSRELVRGHAWSVFGVIILFALLVLVLGGTIEILAASAGAGAALIAEVVVSVLTLPLLSLAAAVLYFELRDLEAPSA